MSFITLSGVTVSFATYQDVVDRDQRLFDSNEGLQDENVIEPLLIRATERILSKIRSTKWWEDYYANQSVVYSRVIPMPSPDLILARQNDFTDLCVFHALSEYILPMIADFGTEDNNEYRKMGYYKQKAEELFMELIEDGAWYDFNGDGVISSSEKSPGIINLKRVR